jgi:structure-specific endonuclease subunit SLX1
MQKGIPAFYGCYLLRSTVRPSSLYVGSTPNPLRRLDQHNGRVKGGAVHTGRVSLRPWEMTCIVGGFASNIAALQFEWAWQNSHLTRHISQDERISFATTRTKTSPRTGRTRRRPARPRTSLTEKLSNLHLLLRSPYFSKWPLELRFFSEDVYRVWQTWCDRVDGRVPDHIKIRLDLKEEQAEATEPSTGRPPKRRKLDLVGKGGVEGVDATYASLRPVLEKGQFVFDQDEQLNCDVCQRPLALNQDLILICPHGECRSISHVDCLAKHLRAESQSETLIPTSGKCPSCQKELQWVDLMKELSIRVRGTKDVQKILKKTKAGANVDMNDDADESDDEGGALTANDIADESQPDDDDVTSVTSVDSECSTMTTTSVLRGGRLEAVVEDSDEEIEILKM